MNELKWNIVFSDPFGSVFGHCITPFPVPECFTGMQNSIISQNPHTNTTILIVKQYIDSSVNGQWKCSHGTNRDQAFANVTVFGTV